MEGTLTTRSAVLGLALIGLVSGCAGSPAIDPDDLEVVAAPEMSEEPVQPRYLLVARLQPAESDAEFNSLDLWVPLPPSGAGQRVGSLIYEVAAPAKVEGTTITPEGDRLLHVRAVGRFPDVLVRATIDLDEVPSASLPKTLGGLGAGLDAGGWVKAALARGHPARLAYGVGLGADGSANPCRFPELEVDRRWVPVDLSTQRTGLPQGTLRLGGRSAWAEADGQRFPVVTSYSLTADP